MRQVLQKKISEAFVSVFPVTLIVFILNLTPLIDLKGDIWIFMISAVFLIIGIGLFNLGADMAMTPMGEHVGSGLTKSKNMLLLLSVCFIMGLFITIAAGTPAGATVVVVNIVAYALFSLVGLVRK